MKTFDDSLRSDHRRDRASVPRTLALGCVLGVCVAGIASGTRASAASPSVSLEQLSKNGYMIGGYPAAKAACQAACGNSPTAHMCAVGEIVRAEQTGLPLVNGWV